MPMLAYSKTQRKMINADLNWVSSDEELFAPSDSNALVVQDFRHLSDFSQVLCSIRPTLYLIKHRGDLDHMQLLMNSGDFYLTPADGMIIDPSLSEFKDKYSWTVNHEIDDYEKWIEMDGRYRVLSPAHACYGTLSKPEYNKIADKMLNINLGSTQHFVSIVGGKVR